MAYSAGLEINSKETKAMTIQNISPENIMQQGQPVEYVDSFCYQESTMTTNGGAETNVDNRLNKVRAAFRQLQSV